MRKIGFLISISMFWLMLSVLLNGITTLLLPEWLLHLSGPQAQATKLGLLSFVSLLAGMLIQVNPTILLWLGNHPEVKSKRMKPISEHGG